MLIGVNTMGSRGCPAAGMPRVHAIEVETVGKTRTKPHILVINDAQEVLEVIRELLEEEGFRVTLYSTAIYDLGKIREIAPDLLILDHLMGDEEYGWQMVQKLRLSRDLGAIPIIVCTAALKMAEELQGHLMTKNVSVIIKPFDIDDLLSAVSNALSRPAQPD